MRTSKKSQLIQAALEIIDKKSLDALTYDSLAKASGMSKSGLLYHFPWSSPVEWCNRFVSFGVGYALSWSGVSSCWVGWGVSRDLVRMSRLR